MATFNTFFRAQNADGDLLPWPETPALVEGAVIVGEVGQSPNYIWHCLLQDPDGFALIQAMPQFMGASYAEVVVHGNGPDVMLALIEENGVRRRVKMRDKPAQGVIEENIPPHHFAGIPA